MMNGTNPRWILIGLGALLLVSAGCGTTAPSRFYVVTPIAESGDTPRADGQDISLGVGPLTIAEYLNRPQIVNHLGGNEISINEYARWAEPLDENFLRVMSDNFSLLLGSDRIIPFPWKGPDTLDFRVVIDIIRLQSIEEDKLLLEARWVLLRPGGDEGLEKDKILVVKRSRIVKEVAGDPEEMGNNVAAGSEAVADLCREIADAIKNAHQK